MQYLEVPITLEDMTTSVSFTGVTILKQSRYKQRHGGLKDIVQVPKQGFHSLKEIRKIERSRQPKQEPKKRRKALQIQKPVRAKQIKRYTVDKAQVKNRIHSYLNCMKGEKMLYFWTVTFPESTTDDTAYLLLNKWFTRLRREKMLKDYLWIAERQDGKRLNDQSKKATGTIHFHIVINYKMCVKKANRFMRASIMHSINDGEINWSREKAKNYNGVDIAKDRKTKRVINFAKQNKQKSLSSYLTKYVTKNNEAFQHLAWHSSRGYSNLITSVRVTELEYHSSNTKNLLDTEKPIETDWFIHYRWKGSPPGDLLNYLANINRHIQEKFN